MAWSAPLTAVAGTALTAAAWNASVRDNLLETAAGKATTAGGHFAVTGTNEIAERLGAADAVLVTETTTSTSYTDLETFGPSVTVETGVGALVMVHGVASNTGTSGSARMAYEVAGATAISPADNRGIGIVGAQGAAVVCSGVALHTAASLPLTPGSNTFTAKYRCSSGTGEFLSRRIVVIPF
ncbi:hypothetical protein J0910_00310 [Nocardiopsis sp. CNT-189]|uniref:hypothetical protein n=1 Tax=Nocardiopsis oceanisediminis TaxID=2816862 RepID=UPI003B29BA6C